MIDGGENFDAAARVVAAAIATTTNKVRVYKK